MKSLKSILQLFHTDEVTYFCFQIFGMKVIITGLNDFLTFGIPLLEWARKSCDTEVVILESRCVCTNPLDYVLNLLMIKMEEGFLQYLR